MILLEDPFTRRVYVVARQAERSFAFALSNSSGNREDFREYYRGFRLEFLKRIIRELEEEVLAAGLSEKWGDRDRGRSKEWGVGASLLPWFVRGKCLRALSSVTGKCPVSATELLYMTWVLKTAASRIETEPFYVSTFTEPFYVSTFIESRMDLGCVQSIIWHHSSYQKKLQL